MSCCSFALQEALLKGLLELVCSYHKRLAGIEEQEEQREVDSQGNQFQTVAEIMAAETAARAARRGDTAAAGAAQQVIATLHLHTDMTNGSSMTSRAIQDHEQCYNGCHVMSCCYFAHHAAYAC
jgi:hypothetical protein